MNEILGKENIDVRIAELPKLYPKGIVHYYFHDQQRLPEIKSILKDNLPGRLVYVTNEVFGRWPGDIGIQMGNAVYSYPYFISTLKHAVADYLGCDYDEINNNKRLLKLLPEEKLNNLEGGRIVVVGGENIMIYNKHHPLFPNHQDVLDNKQIKRAVKKSSYRLLVLGRNLDYYLAHFAKENIPEGEREAYFFGHIDFILTGFRRIDGSLVFYMEKQLLEWLKSTKANDKSLPLHRLDQKALIDYLFGNVTSLGEIRPIDAQYVLRGGCNLKFLDGKVLVPSLDVLGPIGEELLTNEYEVVELGDDQFAKHGGVKCRTLDASWRTTHTDAAKT